MYSVINYIYADSWESLGLKGDQISQSYRKSTLNIHRKDWCRSWNSSTLATWCEELIHWKRPWCWKRLKVGGEGDDRRWDGWMASPTQWTWVWVNSGSWWWTGRPGVLQSMGLQRVGHDWATELNWTYMHTWMLHEYIQSIYYTYNTFLSFKRLGMQDHSNFYLFIYLFRNKTFSFISFLRWKLRWLILDIFFFIF